MTLYKANGSSLDNERKEKEIGLFYEDVHLDLSVTYIKKWIQKESLDEKKYADDFKVIFKILEEKEKNRLID